ncbi:MAG: CoA transferase [Acidimicrobiales bacterium]
MAALDGMRILDLTQYEAGPSATQALAWLGADVVKVERPGVGDPGRGTGPAASYFHHWNANKRSVTLDLSSPDGRALLLELVPRFDVFAENLGPGVIELGLGYDDVLRRAPRRHLRLGQGASVAAAPTPITSASTRWPWPWAAPSR